MNEMWNSSLMRVRKVAWIVEEKKTKMKTS
jgi:hypothetical protein